MVAERKTNARKTRKKTAVKAERSSSSSSSATTSGTIYKDFSVYDGKKAPSWHPIRKMRYIFFRMIGGCTITDAIREIHWSAAEFWHLVDLKRHGPFREEYKRAKVLQGRAFGDSVVVIAEGRDKITRLHKRRMDKLIAKIARKLAKSKNVVTRKMIMQQLMADLREHDKIIITRNKLQIEASKWIAKTANPNEFGETSKLSLGTPSGDGDDKQQPLLIQFIGPDGKVVPV